jgi:hypothetical protein
MLRNGILAVVENGVVNIRSDQRSNPDVLSALESLSKGTPSTTRTVQDSDSGCSGSTNCNDGSNLTVIGSTVGTYSGVSFQTFFSANLTGTLMTFQTLATIPSQKFQGPQYLIQRLQSCPGQVASSMQSQMGSLATDVLGGAATPYLNPASAQGKALYGAAGGLLAGTVSATGFYDVLVAVTTSISLPEILGAAGLGLTVGAGAEMAHCLFTGSP